MYSVFIVLVCIVVLTVLIMKCKVHAFFALIIAGVIAGLMGGLNMKDAVALVLARFGSSASGIAVLIGLAVVLGQIMDESGAAEK